MDTILY